MSVNIGDDVWIDLAGTVTAVEPGRLTIRATEGGAVWSVGTVVDVPAGAVVEQVTEPDGYCPRDHGCPRPAGHDGDCELTAALCFCPECEAKA